MSSPDEARPSAPDFLTGGGEMGALMRAHDWSASPLGAPGAWPQPLKTAVRLILNTGHPMYIWWGPDLLCFYNDAYCRTLGPERHPGSLGQPGREVWSEIWHLIGHQVDFVMAGRGSTWDENRAVPITRFGRLDEIYWTYSYSPIDDGTSPDGVGGVLVVCTETTQAVLAERRRAAETERQRRLFEQAPGFIAVLSGSEHVFKFASAAYRRLIGGRDTVGKTVREALPEPEGQGFFDLLDGVFATGKRFVAEQVPIRLDNPGDPPEERFLDFIYEPVTDEAGQVTGVFIEGHDVTERVRAEARLLDAEERYLALFNGIDQGFCTIEVAFDEHDRPVDYRFLEISPSFERQTGIENGEGRWMRDIAPDQDQFWFDTYGRVALTGEPARFENYSTPLDRWFDVYAFRISGPRRVAVLFRDITDEKRAEAALLESEARFRLMADAVPQIIWMTDRHGRMEFLNKQFVDYTGAASEAWSPAEMAANFIHEDDGVKVVAAFEAALRTGEPFEIEHRIRSAAGEDRWFLARAEPYRDPQTGEIARWFGASIDIHDRKLAEEQLRALNETLESRVAEALADRKLWADVFQSSDALIAALAPDHRFLALNKAYADEFERIYGMRPDVGDSLGEILKKPEHRAAALAVWDRALAGEEFVLTEEFGDPDRDRPYYELRFNALRDREGNHIGAFQYAVDVSERLRAQTKLAEAEEQLRQSQKLESMGQLTGGVAHDVNNLLTPIMGSLDLLRRRGLGGEREQRMIDGALQSAERAKTLVQRLLAFARRQPLQATTVEVGKLVGGMIDLVASTSGPRVQVELDVATDLPPAKADANQLEMALLNLAVNSRDAMPDGGRLTISAKPEIVGSGHRANLAPGEYVRLSVADTGVGMEKTTLDRCIEPFYSTKGIGKGTGLGLSMVHGLAAQLGGAMAIGSKPGVGTSVELWLPVSRETARTAAEPLADGPKQGTGTALLVDDEELVRISTADMLADMGYAVVEAGSAEEALRLVESGLCFDLLVTDHLMPGMTGAELAREVRARHPGTPVLVVSGYAEVEGIAPDLPRLTKPYRRDDLAASVADLHGG